MRMKTISSWILRDLMKKRTRAPTRRLNRMMCPTKSPEYLTTTKVAGVETQHPANGDEHDDCHSQVYGRHSQVLGVELQSPNSEELMVQPICCLAHSYKTNIVFTERLLLRNSSKDKEESDKKFTSPDGQGVITMKPMTSYRRSGENLGFLNDCLTSQIEAIIQELERGGRSDPKFWSLIYPQKKPQNETIIEKLETRECGGPRSLILLRTEKELEKDGRSNPKFLDPIKNKKKGSKNETIDGELEGGGRSDQRFWIIKGNQEELQNQTSLELEGGGRDYHRLLDLIKNKKRSENEMIRGLEGKAWRSLETNVLYSIHCTVQYHDGAVKENRVDFSAVGIKANTGDNDSKDEFADPDTEEDLIVDMLKAKIGSEWDPRRRNGTHGVGMDPRRRNGPHIYPVQKPSHSYCCYRWEDKADFSAVVIKVNTGDHDSKDRFADTDIERSLMIDVFKIEIHDNNCMETNFTPDRKYGSKITTKEDKADSSTVVIKVNIDGNESEDKFVDIDIKKGLIVDGLGTKAYETNCMGTHLTPTCTGPEIYYSNMPNGSQDIATVEGDSSFIEFNVDKEVDTDGDRTVPVLQWLERRDTERSPSQATDPVTSPLVYFVVKEIKTESAPGPASTWSVEETP